MFLYDTTLRDGTQREGLSLSVDDKLKIAHRLDADYAVATLRAAAGAGADCIVLCDTNGGELPEVVEQRVRDVRAQLGTPLGIHPHNDSGLAVANALAAVRAGCVHIQGTINGYGERCGNLDLIPLIATLQLKVGCAVLPPEQLRRLREVALFVAAVANLNPDAHAPYVGASAFAHKAGIHVAAVAKLPESYQHIDPALVGNEMRVVVSELSGRQNVRLRADLLGLAADVSPQDVLQQVKTLEYGGHQFEAADGSFEMLVRRSSADYRAPFELLGFTVIVERRSGGEMTAQAMIQLRVGNDLIHTAADGAGPVNALDNAVRKALLPHYPELADVRLVDYQVRIVDEHLGTAAKPRVVVESASGAERWSTMGCSENIIEASWQALRDSLELPLLRRRS